MSVWVLALVACGPPAAGGDAGSADVGSGGADAGQPDSGWDASEPRDAGQDGGLVDAGRADAGADGGSEDAGLPQGCTDCHGSDGIPAPPLDTQGRSDPSLPSVGAHRAHLEQTSLWRAARCKDCHVVPTHMDDPGHRDPSPAELTWGELASKGGVLPEYQEGGCRVYCHGVTLTGGRNNVPQWTGGAGETGCNGCHGFPPPPPHPPSPKGCAPCHPFDGWVPSNPERHIDGNIDFTDGCTACHGDSRSPAPPLDTQGNTETTARGVGAHRAHLESSDWHATVWCRDCHVTPGDTVTPGHLDGDGRAEVIFGDLDSGHGASPTWDGARCSGTYCHGATLSGGTDPSPEWTRVDGTQATCGGCHGLPPEAPHPDATACGACHQGVVDAFGVIIAPERHIDGRLQISDDACGACHPLPPQSGTHLLHAGLAEPVYGSLSAADALPSPGGYAFGCGHCHPMDPARHLNGGLAEIELFDPLAPAWTLKGRNPPTAQYTPGSVQLRAADGLPYTEGTCSNVYCHSAMTINAPDVPEPGVDFPFGGYPIVYPPYAVTRTRVYRDATWGEELSCGGCHGYPPRTRAPEVEAGAGDSHSFIDASGAESLHAWNHSIYWAPLACRTCHYGTVKVEAAWARDAAGVSSFQDVAIAGYDRHVDGQPDVVFDTLHPVQYRYQNSLVGAGWDPGSKTCSNVACHRSQTSVAWGTPFRFNNGWECNVCHQY